MEFVNNNNQFFLLQLQCCGVQGLDDWKSPRESSYAGWIPDSCWIDIMNWDNTKVTGQSAQEVRNKFLARSITFI